MERFRGNDVLLNGALILGKSMPSGARDGRIRVPPRCRPHVSIAGQFWSTRSIFVVVMIPVVPRLIFVRDIEVVRLV